MSEINVISRTQQIIVDPVSRSVSIINAGPIGPGGPMGEMTAEMTDEAIDAALDVRGIPAGGLPGQVLMKMSNADNDLAWVEYPFRHGYMQAQLGTIVTNDTPDMTITGPVRLSFKARFENGANTGTPTVVYKHSGPMTDREFMVYRNAANDDLTYSGGDAAGNQSNVYIIRPTPLDQDYVYMCETNPNSTAAFTFFDGIRTQQTFASGGPAWKDTANTVVIGNLSLFGRIYWVKLEKLSAVNGLVSSLVWKFDADEIETLPTPILNDILDLDSDSNGIADGWVSYVAGTPPASASLSMVNGHQRITAAINATNQYYGIAFPGPPTLSINPGTTLNIAAKLSGTRGAQAVAQIWNQYYNASGAYVSSGAAAIALVDSTPRWYAAQHVIPTGTGITSVRPTVRVYSGGTPDGSAAHQITLDVHEVRVDQAFVWTDPRGRQWTITNPAAIFKHSKWPAGLPLPS